MLPEVEFPFVVLQGDKDEEVPLWGSQKIVAASKTKAKDKQIIVYAGAKHNVFVLFPLRYFWCVIDLDERPASRWTLIRLLTSLTSSLGWPLVSDMLR